MALPGLPSPDGHRYAQAPLLKGLAETRARAAGSLQRHRKLLDDVERKLKVPQADAC